jgi:hypothetical protein
MQMYFNDSDGVLPWIDPIAGADENENSTDLFEVLGAYIDAPRPRREIVGDDTTAWIVQDPYACPADREPFDDESGNGWSVHQANGTSYDGPWIGVYVALELFDAIDPDHDDPKVARAEKWKGQRAVSRAYDQYANRGETLPIILDFAAVHPAKSGKNALYWDGSADIYPGDPPSEFIEEFLALALKLCNFGS